MGFILFIHVIVCILLVVTVLMQAGRGGGLAESFSSAESMFGTQTNTFMVRCSTVLAVIFLATSLILAVNSSKTESSLMSTAKIPTPAVNKTAAPVEEATVKVSEPKPIAPQAVVPAANAPAAKDSVTTNSTK